MSGDREALVSMLAGAGVWLDRCPEIADTILASDWLAERDKRTEVDVVTGARADWVERTASVSYGYTREYVIDWIDEQLEKVRQGVAT